MAPCCGPGPPTNSLERIDGSDDEPPNPSGGNGFGPGSAKEQKRAKGDLRGLLLSKQTHRSSSDGEARLFKKAPGVGAFLSFMGHCLMDNRHGLVVASEVTPADGYGERAAALRIACSLVGAHQKTLGAACRPEHPGLPQLRWTGFLDRPHRSPLRRGTAPERGSHA